MHIGKCCKCGAGGATYYEDSGEYQNYITCSNKACGFRASGDWINDPKLFERWDKGEGLTIKQAYEEFAEGTDLPKIDYYGKYWREI